MKESIKVLIGIFLILVIYLLGAVSHERDMYREYRNTGRLQYTSWVTDWDFENDQEQTNE